MCKQFIEHRVPYNQIVTKSARIILARNLKKLMDGSKDLSSQSAIARKAKPKVAQTTIGYMLKPDSIVGSPTIEKMEAVAAVFGLEAWQLLHPSMGDHVLKEGELELYRRLREDLAKLDK